MRTFGLFSALAGARAGYNKGQAAGDEARQRSDLAEAAQMAQLYAQQRATRKDEAELGLQRDRLELDRDNAQQNRVAASLERGVARESRTAEREAAERFQADQNEMNRQNARAIAGIAQQGRQATAGRQQSAQEVRLAGQYMQNPVIKNAYELAQNLDKIEAAAATPTPAGDISLVFAYMKMLDPGSTVREGEQAQARNAAGVPDRIRNLYNQIIKGNTLNPTQRGQFVDMARELSRSQSAETRPIMQRYGAASRRMGADSSFVAPDPFETSAVGAGRPGTRTTPAARSGPIDIGKLGLEPPPTRRANP
jgi:hypothetical protein